MTRFKIGDKVKAAKGCDTVLLLPEKVFTVVGINENGGAMVDTLYDLNGAEGPFALYYPDESLTLVEGASE